MTECKTYDAPRFCMHIFAMGKPLADLTNSCRNFALSFRFKEVIALLLKLLTIGPKFDVNPTPDEIHVPTVTSSF